MKKTIIFLPKFFYAAIFIFVVFGLVWFPVDGDSGLLEESEIQQQKGYYEYSVSDNSFNVEISPVNFGSFYHWFNPFLNVKAISKDIMAGNKLAVNNFNFTDDGLFEKVGTMINTPSQPAERFINKSAITDAQTEIGFTEKYTNRFIKLMSIGVIPAYAAETIPAKPIPLSLYQPLAGQIMFREALEKLPVEQRTPEKIAELITGISRLLSSFPAKGEIFLAGGKFSGLTGTSGILAGKVVKGTYRIKIDPVEGIDLIVPAAVEAGLHGPETVMIGLTPGKGKVKTAGETGVWQKVWQMIRKTDKKESQVLGTQVQSEIGDALPTAVLTIQLFRDENKNGVYDSGESLVEWAGVKMDLEPTTQSSSYNLTEGWNLIAFPVVPTSVTTAAEAVQDIAKEGGYVTTISTWEGDKWIEYSQRGLEKFGHDFAIVPGRAYFLESQMNSVWTVAGTPLPAENQVIQLKKGWNGVGILKEGVTAVQILDELQAVGEVSQTSPCEVCEIAEQAAKWNFGLWDVVVKRRYSPEHHEVYGRDFPVKSTQGYFLHLNQDTKLKFQ